MQQPRLFILHTIDRGSKGDGAKKGAHQNTYNTAVFSEFSTWLVGGLGVEKGAGARGVGLLFRGGGFLRPKQS